MKHRILVVEDEPAVSRGVKDALSFNGYIVDVAGDGEAGYDLAREHHFDMIVLDLMLPGWAASSCWPGCVARTIRPPC